MLIDKHTGKKIHMGIARRTVEGNTVFPQYIISENNLVCVQTESGNFAAVKPEEIDAEIIQQLGV